MCAAQMMSLLIAALLSFLLLPIIALARCCRSRRRVVPSSILITGATSGLGAELAVLYAERLKTGVSLALTGRNAEALERTAAACRNFGARVRTATLDVIKRDELCAWIRSVDAACPLDLVIANAGVTERTAGVAVGDIEAGARSTFSANVDGVFNSVFPALPAMRERCRGQVCVISSIASYNPFSIFDGYAASKAAVRLWAEGLRQRLHCEGILVSVVTPGYISGPMTAAFGNAVDLRGIVTQRFSASKIVEGLERDDALIAFPFSTFVASTMLAALPHAVRDLLAQSRFVEELCYAKNA